MIKSCITFVLSVALTNQRVGLHVRILFILVFIQKVQMQVQSL